jgi:hypothetical protein
LFCYRRLEISQSTKIINLKYIIKTQLNKNFGALLTHYQNGENNIRKQPGRENHAEQIPYQNISEGGWLSHHY